MNRKFSRARKTLIQKRLKDLAHGNFNEMPQPTIDLSELLNPPYKQINRILLRSKNEEVRENAAYFLSWVHRQSQSFKDTSGVHQFFDYLRPRHRRKQENYEAVNYLLRIFRNRGEADAVRAQTLEGFALHRVPKKHRLYAEVEKAILAGLDDESVIVRFWACYAAGNIGCFENAELKSALPKLREIMENDRAFCPHWWFVAQEAADATNGILKRPSRARTPINELKVKHKIKFFFEIAREKRSVWRWK